MHLGKASNLAMNKFVDIVVTSTTRSGLVPLVMSLEAQNLNLLRILVYHRIGDPGAESGFLDPTLLSATPQMFEQQINFLVKNYRLISIRDLLQAIEDQQPLPPQSVMITFDDGYRNFLDIAWPIIEHYQIPALLFLPTGFLSPVNQLFWWDRLYQGILQSRRTRLSFPTLGDYPLVDKKQRWEAFIQLKRKISCLEHNSAMMLVGKIFEVLEVTPETTGLLLNWSDARLLNEHGCYLAAHTRNHPILSRIPRNIARKEIQGGQEDIYREIGRVWPVFAYPSGHPRDCSDDLSQILYEEGFKLAMTSIPGINVMSRVDLLRLKRIGLSPRVTLTEFQLLLTGIFQFYCNLQNLFSPSENH